MIIEKTIDFEQKIIDFQEKTILTSLVIGLVWKAYILIIELKTPVSHKYNFVRYIPTFYFILFLYSFFGSFVHFCS